VVKNVKYFSVDFCENCQIVSTIMHFLNTLQTEISDFFRRLHGVRLAR